MMGVNTVSDDGSGNGIGGEYELYVFKTKRIMKFN